MYYSTRIMDVQIIGYQYLNVDDFLALELCLFSCKCTWERLFLQI